jgi:hypothetical protein
MSDAPVKDVAAVEKEILDILGKDTISEADQKVLHDLRAEHPDHFKAVVETAPAVSGRGAEVTAAADAHAARVAASTPPAPAPTTATPVATNHSELAEIAAKERAAQIEDVAKSDELLKAVKSGEKEKVQAILRKHPGKGSEIIDAFSHHNEREFTAQAKMLNGLKAELVVIEKEVGEGMKVIDTFLKAEKGKGDTHAVEQLLKGKHGEEYLARLAEDGSLDKLAAHGINAETVVAEAKAFAKDFVKPQQERLTSLLEKAKKTTNPKVQEGISKDIEAILKQKGGIEAYQAMEKEEQDALKKLVPNVEGFIREVESFVKAQGELGKLFVSKDVEGVSRLVVEDATAAGKLINEHGPKLLKGLPEDKLAALHRNPEVSKVITDIEGAIKTAQELGAKGRALVGEDAAKMKELFSKHGKHILEAHGEDKTFMKTMEKTFDKEWESMKAAASKSTGEAGKAGELFKKATGFLRWSEEALAKEATKSGKTVAELAKEGKELGKFRGSRLAMLGGGVAAITAMFVAGSGNSGPGERAASIQQQGLGAAAGQGLA